MLSINPMTMANASSQPIPIDPEWANSLVGLRLLVPDSWWVNCSGEELNEGVLGAHYPMRYDSVFSFADEDQDNFKTFRLPRYPIGNPEGEEVDIP